MIIKERSKSKTLRLYESLAQRMKLSTEDYLYYRGIASGHTGECNLDTPLRALTSDCLIVNDLQLYNGKSEFQIDSLVLKGGKLLVLDVKNYTGINQWSPYYFKRPNDRWLENPLLQLEKMKARFGIHLHNLGYDLIPEYRVLFVNPEFTLTGTDRVPEFVLPSELPGFLRQLNQPAPPVTAAEWELARKLMAGHDPDYMARKRPKYSLAKLKRGILCPNCAVLGMALKGHRLSCYSCGHQLSVQEGIRESVAEFRLLFPDTKVTTQAITDWCGGVSSDRVYRALQSSFQAVGKNRGRYYV